jgi:hypothetical protein
MAIGADRIRLGVVSAVAVGISIGLCQPGARAVLAAVVLGAAILAVLAVLPAVVLAVLLGPFGARRDPPRARAPGAQALLTAELGSASGGRKVS